MQTSSPPIQGVRGRGRILLGRASRLAVDEHELAMRWGLSVKTLRRWRQQGLGPIFCKFGSRVTYLITEVESFERRVSRHSTSASVNA